MLRARPYIKQIRNFSKSSASADQSKKYKHLIKPRKYVIDEDPYVFVDDKGTAIKPVNAGKSRLGRSASDITFSEIGMVAQDTAFKRYLKKKREGTITPSQARWQKYRIIRKKIPAARMRYLYEEVQNWKRNL